MNTIRSKKNRYSLVRSLVHFLVHSLFHSLVFLALFLLVSERGSFVFARGRQEEQYFVVLENPQDYASIRLREEMLENSTNLNMEIYLDNTPNTTESRKKINFALNNKAVVITFQSTTQSDLLEIVDYAKNMASRTRTQYLTSFIFLTTLPRIEENLTLPWAFVGFDTKDIAEKTLQKVENRLGDISSKSVVIYSQAAMSACKSLQTLESLIAEEEKSDKKEKVYKNDESNSLSHSVFGHIHQKYSNANEVYLPCYDRYNSYTETLKRIETQNDDVVLTFNDEVAIGVALAYKKAGKAIPLIVGYGGSPEIKKYIDNKTVFASIEPDYKMFAQQILKIAEQFFYTYAGVSTSIKTDPQLIYIPYTFIE